MTIYSILSQLCRLAGLFQWADALWRTHELTVKAQEIADAPKTRTELEKDLEDGKL